MLRAIGNWLDDYNAKPLRRGWKRWTAARYVVPAAVLAAIGVSAVAQHRGGSHPLSGHVQVVDGDTLRMGSTAIRLWGIDAPEANQYCRRPTGQDWACGQEAAKQLRQYIAGGSVQCDPEDVDRYGRTVAVCYVGGVELNAWLVGQGWAVDYRKFSRGMYASEEAEARSAKLGLWSGEFAMPWAFRARGGH